MAQIRQMRAADVSLGIALCRQAKWNQTDADWQRFLAMAPGGCFVAEVDRQPVGTVTAFTFGKVAWIAMVLVDESARGKGVGTALMSKALDYLDSSGVSSVRLDATPMGQPIYEKLGFAVDFGLARYEGTLPKTPADDAREPAAPEGLNLRLPRNDELGEIVALDASVTKTDRLALIEQMWHAGRSAFRVVEQQGRITGYLWSRAGCNATQLGPAIAADDVAGRLLLRDAAERFAGTAVFVDVPDDHAAALEMIKRWGLTKQRPFARMTRGQAVGEEVSRLWLSSGPEKG